MRIDLNPLLLNALKTLKTRSIWISAINQTEGNKTFADTVNWASRYSHVSRIHIKTVSTNWDAWLCVDNTFNKTDIRTLKIMTSGNGDSEIFIGTELNSADNNVYLIFTDNVGVNTFDILISGEARRH